MTIQRNWFSYFPGDACSGPQTDCPSNSYCTQPHDVIRYKCRCDKDYTSNGAAIFGPTSGVKCIGMYMDA